jgi:hypothetical protein
MLAFLILAVTFGFGIASGYGVRDLSSRRRRYRHRHGKSSPQPDRQPAPADHLTINLDRLLVAANDDVAMRRRQHSGQRLERREKPDDFDGAVRDLLSELNRRSSEAPAPVRRVQG